MLSSNRIPSAPAPAPAPAPRPQSQPAGYAGQVPSGPVAAAAPAVPASNNRTLIIVAVVILVLLCCCIGGLIAYDQFNLWCSPLTSWLVPIITGGKCQ